MAFSADVKGELCRPSISRRCCAQAEAYGVLLFCGAFHPRQARIVTECGALKERLPLLFRKAFKTAFDQTPEPGEGKGRSWRRTIAGRPSSGGRFWRGDR